MSAEVVVEACHDILNTAATLLANMEYLVNPATGSNADREAAAADAVDSVRRLAEIVRQLQDTARQASERAA